MKNHATLNLERRPIPDLPFYNSMRRGHLLRTGHELTGYQMEPLNDGYVELHRTCC